MPHTAKVTDYIENTGTGKARCFVEISDDLDPTTIIATMGVSDTIANMDARIREDVVKAVQQIRGEADAIPAKTSYAIADDDTVT